MRNPGHTSVGTWSGGRFMHFGEPVEEERLAALLRPGGGISTVLTADTYGAGDADALLGRALQGVDRDAYCLVGAIGHDFYTGEREGAKGFPRFTDPRLRGPDGYAGYVRMAVERSLERCGVDAFDVLLLHNPDRTGYTSEAVWDALEAVRADGLAGRLGVAPGPANGFTLDLIDCFERFGDRIDWAMVILNPLEPWPGELVLDAAARHDVQLITRVVDYGGLFHDDVLPGHAFPRSDHRSFRPAGWVERGRERLERMRPIAERHGLTPAPARVRVEPGARPRGLRGAHADPGAGGWRPADRGQAGRARGGARRKRALGRRGRRDPRDRRQHRVDGAQGRGAGLRGRRAPGPLADQRRPAGTGRALGDRPRARSGACGGLNVGRSSADD